MSAVPTPGQGAGCSIVVAAVVVGLLLSVVAVAQLVLWVTS